MVNYVDIVYEAKTKIDEYFPTVQFAIDGFHKSLRLNATDKIGSLFVYVRSYLLLRRLTKHEISFDIQVSIAKLSIFPRFIT